MRLGEFELMRVSGGRFRLDGGAMFGVVPKPLWNRVAPSDEFNRIQLDTNCIVVRTPLDLVVIDSGYGTKLVEKERQQLAVEQPLSLAEGMRQRGIEPEEVTLVLPSHLHFDHASGLTYLDEEGVLCPTFPNARIVVQRAEWEDALGNAPELAGNYPVDELRQLERWGKFSPVDGTFEPTPGFRVKPTGGHTRGHQLIQISSEGEQAVYLGDVCPTTAHLKTFWTMAYDLFPLNVRQLKPQLLGKAIKRQQWVLFDHDPVTPVVRLNLGPKNYPVVSETMTQDDL